MHAVTVRPAAAGYSNNFTLDDSFVTDVGRGDTLGNAIVVRTPPAPTRDAAAPPAVELTPGRVPRRLPTMTSTPARTTRSTAGETASRSAAT
jgi:hypothetical protein